MNMSTNWYVDAKGVASEVLQEARGRRIHIETWDGSQIDPLQHECFSSSQQPIPTHHDRLDRT